MRTYRLLLIAVVACFVMAFVSCGSDEPSGGGDDGKITRVQDGDGKAFLEDGKLVDANLKYTRELRDSAFSHYDWTFEYAICYDNKRISGKIKDIKNYTPFPDSIGSDFTMRFKGRESYQYSYELDGRKLIAKLFDMAYYNLYEPPHSLKVVAIDISGAISRVIIDERHEKQTEGFSVASSYLRMVFSGKRVK